VLKFGPNGIKQGEGEEGMSEEGKREVRGKESGGRGEARWRGGKTFLGVLFFDALKKLFIQV
jgi:hypothetical protein